MSQFLSCNYFSGSESGFFFCGCIASNCEFMSHNSDRNCETATARKVRFVSLSHAILRKKKNHNCEM